LNLAGVRMEDIAQSNICFSLKGQLSTEFTQ
jgi:hypothetical protein